MSGDEPVSPVNTRAGHVTCWNACDRGQEWSMSGDEPVSPVMSGRQDRREHSPESGLPVPPWIPRGMHHNM